jgi:hypothetical protein
MYILNPNEDQLKSWYCTNDAIIWRYLIKHIPVIHRKGNKHYFVKTKEWESCMKEMPFGLRILDFLKI